MMSDEKDNDDLFDLPPSPFAGANSKKAAAESWRVSMGPLIEAIQRDAKKTKPSVMKLDEYHKKSKIVADCTAQFYSDKADPIDRTGLIDWIGATAAILDRKMEKLAYSPAHVFAARLMQSWAHTQWIGIDYPDWAKEVLKELFQQLANFGPKPTPDLVNHNMKSFLEGHQRSIKTMKIAKPRSLEREWDRFIFLACMSLKILADIEPDKVSPSLIEGVMALEENYDKVGDVRLVVHLLQPATGLGVAFEHRWWHEGQEATQGFKYVLRTDVLYGQEGNLL
jgi:hypothetical protein